MPLVRERSGEIEERGRLLDAVVTLLRDAGAEAAPDPGRARRASAGGAFIVIENMIAG